MEGLSLKCSFKASLAPSRLKACLIKLALSDSRKPVYWKDIEPLYTEIKRLHEGILAEGKRLAETLCLKWQALKELWRSKHIDWKQYQGERDRLEAQAWEALEALKEKYDKAFSDLEERIKARLRARGPQNRSPIVGITLRRYFQILQ